MKRGTAIDEEDRTDENVESDVAEKRQTENIRTSVETCLFMLITHTLRGGFGGGSVSIGAAMAVDRCTGR
jgi:hypothetical protein